MMLLMPPFCRKDELEGVDEVLPDDVGGRSDGRHGLQIGLRQPHAEGGVLLPERLSCSDAADLGHGVVGGIGIDEDIVVVLAAIGRWETVADVPAEQELQPESEQRAQAEDEYRPPVIMLSDKRIGEVRHQQDEGCRPEVEGHGRPCAGEGERPARVVAAMVGVAAQTQEPCGEERSEQKGTYLAEYQPKGFGEVYARSGVDNGEKGGYDNRRGDIAEEGESGEVLYAAAQFARDDGGCGGGWHDDTDHDALGDDGDVAGRDAPRGGDGVEGVEQSVVDNCREHELHAQDQPMPYVQAQVERVDLAEREKEHQENERREHPREMPKPRIARRADEHGECECVAVDKGFDSVCARGHGKPELFDNHHSGTETILGKRGVLVLARGVMIAQFGGDGSLEHPLAAPVNEDNLLALVADVVAHGAAKNIHLKVEHFTALHLLPIVG